MPSAAGAAAAAVGVAVVPPGGPASHALARELDIGANAIGRYDKASLRQHVVRLHGAVHVGRAHHCVAQPPADWCGGGGGCGGGRGRRRGRCALAAPRGGFGVHQGNQCASISTPPNLSGAAGAGRTSTRVSTACITATPPSPLLEETHLESIPPPTEQDTGERDDERFASPCLLDRGNLSEVQGFRARLRPGCPAQKSRSRTLPRREGEREDEISSMIKGKRATSS